MRTSYRLLASSSALVLALGACSGLAACSTEPTGDASAATPDSGAPADAASDVTAPAPGTDAAPPADAAAADARADAPLEAGLATAQAHFQVLAPGFALAFASDAARLFYVTAGSTTDYPRTDVVEVHAIAKDAGVPGDVPPGGAPGSPGDPADTSVVLARVEGSPGLALLLREGAALYWTTVSPAAASDAGPTYEWVVHRVPTDGSGGDQVLFHGVELVALDAQFFYVHSADTLQAVPRAGGDPVVLATEAGGFTFTFVTATDLYWTTTIPSRDAGAQAGALRRRPRAGGPTSTLYVVPDGTPFIGATFDGKTIACVEQGGRTLVTYALDTQAVDVSQHDPFVGLGGDGHDLFLAGENLVRAGANGAPDAIVAPYAGDGTLLAEPDAIYVGRLASPNVIMKYAH